MQGVQGLAPVSAEGLQVAGVKNTRGTNADGFHLYKFFQRALYSVTLILAVIYCDSQSLKLADWWVDTAEDYE